MSKEKYEEMCRVVKKTITNAWAPVFERARAIGLYPLENRAMKATKEKLDFLFDNRLAFKVSREDSKIAVEFDYDECTSAWWARPIDIEEVTNGLIYMAKIGPLRPDNISVKKSFIYHNGNRMLTICFDDAEISDVQYNIMTWFEMECGGPEVNCFALPKEMRK